jgi:hypothetical protein
VNTTIENERTVVEHGVMNSAQFHRRLKEDVALANISHDPDTSRSRSRDRWLRPRRSGYPNFAKSVEATDDVPSNYQLPGRRIDPLLIGLASHMSDQAKTDFTLLCKVLQLQ